jgi:gamma-glutamylcyclotransferase (GGCT)/AIG2-like uncharacterized protein YtfP
MLDKPSHLFVYGTLMRRSRSPYAKLLRTRAKFAGVAFAWGRLYHLGRFPGAVFDENCPTKVFGEVFHLNGLALLDALDAYEGCRLSDPKPQLFRRALTEVQFAHGGQVTAWTYPFAGSVSGRLLITSGRFRPS